MTAPQPSSENRRPLKTRGWAIFQRLAAALARWGVTPNAISVSSAVFGCAAGGALAATGQTDAEALRRACWIAAAVCIQLRLIANLLDGMVAVECGKQTPVGELYNEVPDRVSDIATLLGAGWAAGGNVLLGCLAAVTAVFVAYARAMGTSVGVGQAFHGPMAKPHRMALITLVAVYCGTTPTAWHGGWHGWGVVSIALGIVVLGGAVTVIRRLRWIAAAMRERERRDAN